MSDFTTRTLVWLTYRLGATIALGIPLVLLIWSGLRRDPALVRLLGIYWKVASLLAISVLLLTDQRPIGYFTAFLAPLLMANPRGVLLARDEMAGWIGSFDRYAGGTGGADAAHWLSMHNGETITVDRKTGNPRTINVPRASVSVTGGIQPAILHRALGVEHRESGLAARLLLTWPPHKPKQWTEADIDPGKEAELEQLFTRLYDLQATINDAGELCPVHVGLTHDAKAAYTEYYNHHNNEQTDLSGELSAAWSKLEEYAARLALVIHFTRWVAGTANSDDVIDAESMQAGIKLAQWFKSEARRIYPRLSESDDDRDQRRLIEWIERKGGSVTAREVQQGHRRW